MRTQISGSPVTQNHVWFVYKENIVQFDMACPPGAY